MIITIEAPLTGRLILIDAYGLIFQVFHAIRDRMTSPSGVPTNALFGFTRDMLFLRSQKPDYLVCVYDSAEKTFRDQLVDDYKANRSPMPEDLQVQMPLIHQSLAALGIPSLTHPEYEADDVLATLAHLASARGLHVWVCTADKDCRQLINDRVKLYNLRKKQEFGRKELLEDWGITPEQAVDLQTLVGDSVDNVQGVRGIGIKTAAKLLQEFGSLDQLLQSLDRIPGKKQENIREALPYLERTRKLVRLATDVPLSLTWDDWKLKPIPLELARSRFEEWGFHSMLRLLRGSDGSGPQQQATLFPEAELFPFGANASEAPASSVASPPAENWVGHYHLVDRLDLFQSFLGDLKQQRRFAFDVETTSLNPLACDLVGIAFCWKSEEAWYLPLRAPQGEAHLDPTATLQELKPLLEDVSIEKVNQNIKYDLLVLAAHGIRVRGIAGDPMIADYLLHAGERSHNLEDLAKRYLKHQVIPITDLIGKTTKRQPALTMDQVSTRRVADYAGEDADVAWRLCEELESRLGSLSRAPGAVSLRKLYHELEIPLIEVLASLEYQGIRLDSNFLARLSQEMASSIEQIESEIYTLAGRQFNIGSLPQLRQVLFEELKLPAQKKTGVTGAASTDQESLEKLATLTHLPGHRLARKILEHRQIVKLKNTYVDTLPELMLPRTGRIHASFNQTVAATGRLSSSDPNLQNIPIRREMGQQIRQAFLPAPGWRLLTADYSQIELRFLAHFSGDETLRKAFAEDRDVHAAIAAEIFGVEQKDVTAEQRRMAKTVNFGVIYGISAVGLSARLSISREEGTRFIDAYFQRYPRVLGYQQRLLEQCRQTGKVTTILGRERAFDKSGIRPQTQYQSRNQTEREAINMEIQGSAADLIKLAMLGVHRRLQAEKLQARMLLQIHDELVFEAPPEEVSTLARLVKEEMTTPLEKQLRLQVPLKVDLASGPNWLDTEPL